MDDPIFKCAKCGADTDVAAPDPAETVCMRCCGDHDYEYDSGAEWALCLHCGADAPHDFYDDQPDDYLP